MKVTTLEIKGNEISEALKIKSKINLWKYAPRTP